MNGHSLAGSGAEDRVEHDYYATDPKSVEALLDAHNIAGCSFYEPACGEGHISKVLKERYPNAKHYSTDLVDRNYQDMTVCADFLSIDFESPLWHNVDWIITNPPFKYAKDFVEKSLKITNTGVAMFLKIQFLESESRKEWLQNSPLKYIYVFSKRQVIFRNGEELDPKTGKRWANTMCFAWFVWEHGYTGEPIVRWV